MTVIRQPGRKQKGNLVRIVSGAHRGRILVAPKGHSTRPTADRVRQALFNVIEHAAWAPSLIGARVADLFAGSGALGLEALSRGAASCVFVERDVGARQAIEANVAALRLEGIGETLAIDATRLPKRGHASIDLAFLDPPYAEGLGAPALTALLASGWLGRDSLAVLEIGANEAALAHPGYSVVDERVWGAAKVVFLTVS